MTSSVIDDKYGYVYWNLLLELVQSITSMAVCTHPLDRTRSDCEAMSMSIFNCNMKCAGDVPI